MRSFLGTARCGSPGRRVAIVRTAFVATYPPRRCGIATFTSDLAAPTGGREIAVLHSAGDRVAYPREVRHLVRKDERGDYVLRLRPYTYAWEPLADGRGVLVDPGSPRKLSDALRSLVGDPALRGGILARA